MTGLTADDRLAIQELNSRYFYAIDGLTALLPGDPDRHWAETFAPDGSFSIVDADGSILMDVQGTDALVEAYRSFPDVATTRHWINDLLIETDGDDVKSGCYIIAMNIAANPAAIVRTGVYRDRLVKGSDGWKFQNRTLILDPNSPAG
ncbi:MAG: nuclear transport factor 2 family protein [Cyanobacteria bacterium J06639_1]